MSRTIDLLAYLPEFDRKIKDFNELCKTESLEFQRLFDAADIAKNQSFIFHANEKGLERFENMLGIVADENDNLEARRYRIIAKWNDSLPYTLKMLKQRLGVICGQGNYTITANYNQYEVYIEVGLRARGQIEELQKILSQIMPANLRIVIKNKIKSEVKSEINVGGIVSSYKIISFSTN